MSYPIFHCKECTHCLVQKDNGEDLYFCTDKDEEISEENMNVECEMFIIHHNDDDIKEEK